MHDNVCTKEKVKVHTYRVQHCKHGLSQQGKLLVCCLCHSEDHTPPSPYQYASPHQRHIQV